MKIRYIEEAPRIKDYNNLISAVGWGEYKKEIMEKAFRNSLYFISAYDEEKLIGMARIVGDGVIFTYIQDVSVHPDYQGKNIGREIMSRILEKISEYRCDNPKINTYLFSVKGKENFYRKFGFILREENDLGPGMSLKIK